MAIKTINVRTIIDNLSNSLIKNILTKNRYYIDIFLLGKILLAGMTRALKV